MDMFCRSILAAPIFTAIAILLLLEAASTPVCTADTTITPVNRDDWRWVKGAVFVPTNAVNEAQQWDEYDPAVNDRELHYASVYGVNCVRAYLHYYIYLKKKDALLNDIEDFLTRANKYGIKVEFVFFDDCWNQPPKELLNSDFKYPAPLPGVHNSQWLVSPGEDARKHYDENLPKLKAYVHDIVNAHKEDQRIAFWETYNEPNKSAETKRLEQDSQKWVHETGTSIPVTATGSHFSGDPYSDFKSWHMYGTYKDIALHNEHELNTECMNRYKQTVPGIVEHFAGKSGFEIWEFGIGRDNCRFSWKENRSHPRPDEPKVPFHGMVYADGHPWSIDDVKAFAGADAFAKAPLFHVEYFTDDNFGNSAKKSVTPMIDFDLPNEQGIGSPDPQAGIPHEHYSAKWTGNIEPPSSGTYNFFIDSDGAVNVAIDGKAVITKKAEDKGEATGSAALAAGHASEISVAYSHGQGAASLHLLWSGPGIAGKIVVIPIASAK
jgi:hypothetical protein